MEDEEHRDDPKEPTAEDQVARLFEWRRGFNAMHLIDIGVRLGLFRAIAETLTRSRVPTKTRRSSRWSHQAVWNIPGRGCA